MDDSTRFGYTASTFKPNVLTENPIKKKWRFP